MKLFNVLLPIAVDFPFTYTYEDDLTIGSFVWVPFRNKELIGVVWGRCERPEMNPIKLKRIKSAVDHLTPLSRSAIIFIQRVSSYNIATLGEVLKCTLCIPQKQMLAPPEKQENNRSTILPKDKLFELSNDQQKIAYSILEEVNQFHVSVLEGVTGSGKTEVYLYLVDEVLRSGKQVLVLVPEIMLTSQLTERFKQRLPYYDIHEWHSSIKGSARKSTWHGVQTGAHNFVVGARSALFLPFANLGLIVVDEEHDQSYKQESGVIYNARDMTVMRAKIEEIPSVLVSATPSIETLYNVKLGKYYHYHLEKRYNEALLPEIKVIDMSIYKTKNATLHAKTREKILEVYGANKQSLLFINRRGYAPIVFCKGCGEKAKCPNCTFFLVYHRQNNLLQCHYCGYNVTYKEKCMHCGEEDASLIYGIGVERVAEEVKSFLPKDAKILMLTSDIINTRAKAEKAISAIMNREVDVIVGTQIIAKGLHFPNLQLVTIVDAVLSNVGYDIRALEKTYQVLHQVMGRAGRESERGSVFLQTHDTQSIMLKVITNGSKEVFAETELENRKQANMPPFSRLVMINFTSKYEDRLIKFVREAAESIIQRKNIQVLGPAPAPAYVINNQYRYRIILRASKSSDIQGVIRQWQKTLDIPNCIKINVDVDPYSFL